VSAREASFSGDSPCPPSTTHQHDNVKRALDTLRLALADERFWMAVYVVAAAIATTVCIGRQCNNFLIFRSAFDHVRVGADLYAAHPREHADLFKYSPTFALVFAPFALLPYSTALVAWNLLSVALIFVALRLTLDPANRLPAVQLTGLALITTIDGTQPNILVAALIILAFAALERRRLRSAAAAIAGGALIKLFPAAALAFALPRRDRWRFGAVFALMLAALVALPLVVTSPLTLLAQYRSWYAMGSVDALDRGASVMRLLHDVAGYNGANWPVQLAGTILLLLPLVRGRWTDPAHRRSFLASLLVYAVIFNHKAEHPSYIIALVGIAIWYSVGPRTIAKTILTGVVVASTVPVFIWVALPGAGDALPALEVTAAACTVAWLGMQAELLDLVPVTEGTLATPEMQPAE
jgi:hypothetical protein